MINPEEAAREARRCITERSLLLLTLCETNKNSHLTKVGFVGIILNDYQSVSANEAPEWAENGADGKQLYYDHPSYDVLWKTLVELDRPLYLHPRKHHGDFYAKRPWVCFLRDLELCREDLANV
jgi:2,3-dihydroxybenzoate decarboxylase